VVQLLGDAVAGTGTPYFLNSSTADILSWVPMNTSLVELGYNGVSLLLDDVQQLVNYTESSTSSPSANPTQLMKSSPSAG
jgi:hypothetical protein